MDPTGTRLLPGKTAKDLTPEELEQLRERARMQNAKEEQLTQLLLSGDMRGLTLMNNISQDTFDEAVKENMEEFEMTREEAIADAIEQFERQGASLAGVKTAQETTPTSSSAAADAGANGNGNANANADAESTSAPATVPDEKDKLIAAQDSNSAQDQETAPAQDEEGKP
ncbi:Hypothetical Protein FCC1311_013002 [Hondaea fermentalgiana]|uniref:Uncharacterized protein n=1 Tax=Hondaea fermentalgiana TaxID=2315210 RepID=A0A2R5G9C3_9STRA|nr:Hypothetical Protein FCC1311_013002 [Hondaea fermentalgiana]|eukprot:GBG25083.1 Hypothetical Protein FCC1311_013002 [Hondaea fermentalgiana]